MPTVDNLRDSIIDQLLSISNEEYLSALHHLVEKTAANNDVVQLSESQVSMLRLSEKDIADGKLITQEDLDKIDLAWLKGQ
jgi:hypothetical protein